MLGTRLLYTDFRCNSLSSSLHLFNTRLTTSSFTSTAKLVFHTSKARRFSASRMKQYKFETKPRANPAAIVQGPNYRFTVLTDRLIRYEWAADGKFEDRASTFAINRDFPVPKFHVYEEGDNNLEIITDHFQLSYDKQRFTASGLLVSYSAKVTDWGAQWRYGHEIRQGNLGGTARTLDEVDGRCDMGRGVCSREGYADVDDTHSMLFDGADWVAQREPGDRIDGYLFGYGHDYRASVKALYQLSGNQPVLPRWALGNWWSRYYAYTQDEYIGLMDKFRTEDVPLSVAVVDMDWHLVIDDRVPHSGWTGYTWDDKLFPDPSAFGRELHSRNLKITLNDHPAMGIHHHEDSYEEMAKFIGHDTSEKDPMMFDPTNKTFMEAYMKILHRNVEKQACDFWWIDWQQGSFSKTPNVDPLWMLNHFHFVDNALPEAGAGVASSETGQIEKRPLIFSRYAGPGSHRYPVGFSGDTVISWASLAFQPEFTNTASNIGYGWWSHDIGGHMFGARDDELTTRWLQYGVFSPIMRLHSSNSAWSSKEPWCYRPEGEKVMSEFLRFRHRMVPFLYTRNVSGSSEGEPLCQPLYWHFPEVRQAYQHPNEYLFGFELLVAPIVEPRNSLSNMAAVKAWLPPLGRFVDIFNGIVYDGNRDIVLHRRIEEYPVLMHEGSIVVLDAASAPVNGCSNPEAFEVLVCVGKNGQASVIEDPADDSEQVRRDSNNLERGSLVQYSQTDGKLTAHVTGRTWSFRFMAVTEIPEGLKVTVNGNEVTKDADIKVETFPKVPSLVVKLPQAMDDKAEIVIELGKDPQLSVVDHTARMKDYVVDLQIEYSKKDELWEVLNDHANPLGIKISRVLAIGLDEAVSGVFTELLLADSRAR